MTGLTTNATKSPTTNNNTFVLSCVQPFVILWAAALQRPLSMEFPRQAYWSGLPFPSLGDLPDPRIEAASLASPAWQVDSLPPVLPGKPVTVHIERGQGSTMPCLGLKRLCVPFPSSNPAISPWGHKDSGTIERRNWDEPCHLHVDKPSSCAGGWEITWRRIHPIQDYTGPAYSQLIPRYVGESSQHQQSCLPNPPLTTEYIPGQKNCPANPETCVQ